MAWWWLEQINRVIIGDTLFGASIWAACVIAYPISRVSKRWGRFAKFAYFLVLSFCLMALAHYAIDAVQNWYVTPLGPHLKF